jgi:hypothetical protein
MLFCIDDKEIDETAAAGAGHPIGSEMKRPAQTLKPDEASDGMPG